MGGSEIYPKRLSAKEVSTPLSGEKLKSPIADGTVKLSGGDSGSENIHLDPGLTRHRRRTKKFSRKMRRIIFNPFEDSSLYDGEARNDFWSISGNITYRHHVEPRVKLFVST